MDIINLLYISLTFVSIGTILPLIYLAISNARRQHGYDKIAAYIGSALLTTVLFTLVLGLIIAYN